MLKRWCFLWMIKINYTERRKKNWKITENAYLCSVKGETE